MTEKNIEHQESKTTESEVITENTKALNKSDAKGCLWKSVVSNIKAGDKDVFLNGHKLYGLKNGVAIITDAGLTGRLSDYASYNLKTELYEFDSGKPGYAKVEALAKELGVLASDLCLPSLEQIDGSFSTWSPGKFASEYAAAVQKREPSKYGFWFSSPNPYNYRYACYVNSCGSLCVRCPLYTHILISPVLALERKPIPLGVIRWWHTFKDNLY